MYKAKISESLEHITSNCLRLIILNKFSIFIWSKLNEFIKSLLNENGYVRTYSKVHMTLMLSFELLKETQMIRRGHQLEIKIDDNSRCNLKPYHLEID